MASWGGLGGGGIGDVLGIFQPGIRYLIEEQERQRYDRVEVGDADPPWAVDLDSGVVTVPAAAGGTPGRSALDRPDGAHHRLRHLAGPVWVATSATWTTQAVVVLAEDGTCLVVDPALTPSEVGALGAELTERGWRPVAGFSTHPHWDHVLWHRALGDVPRFATPKSEAKRS